MNPRLPAAGLLLAALALSAGCMKLGPEYARPQLAQPPAAGFQHSATGARAYLPQDRWWRTFGDADLNAMVERAVERNWDIKKAAARVMEVRAQFVSTRADRYPSLGLEGKAQKQQTTETSGLPAAFFLDRRYETLSLSLAASFELDLWGRLARAEEAARADLLQAEENRRTVVQGLIAQVVDLYLQMQASERRLAVSDMTVQALSQSLEFVEARYSRGLTSILDVQQARRTLAQAKALAPDLRRALAKQQQALKVLAGDYPSTSPARTLPADYFHVLEPVPAGLPSQLLLRRPDLRSAEAGLKALTARVGVAKAARFPRIAITGALGYSSDALSRLIEPASQLWSLAGGVSQSVFDAGKLAAGQRAAEARLAQGVAEYAKKVLTAFSEVEEALVSRQQLLERHRLVKEALDEARATQDTAESRYQRGLADYLTVLDAQRNRYTLEDTLVVVEQEVLANRVTLHRALGGGWDALATSPLARNQEVKDHD